MELKKLDGSLSVYESIICLRDRIRTKKLLIGVANSVRKLSKNNQSIYVCDAGCGAIPILAIYAALVSHKVSCICLEINPNSIIIANEILKALGLEHRIKLILTDAKIYKAERQFDLLISETMHSGLTAEPMVQIMSNLAPQVKFTGIILPSRVIVMAAMLNFDNYKATRDIVSCGGSYHIFTNLSWQTFLTYKPGDKLNKITIDLFAYSATEHNCIVMLTSEVNIGSESLLPYQSLITMPQIIRDEEQKIKLFNIGKDFKIIHIEYEPGTELDKIPSTIKLAQLS